MEIITNGNNDRHPPEDRKLSGIVLTPGWDRIYRNERTAKAAFLAGFDWTLRSPVKNLAIVSIRDFKPGQVVELRFGKYLNLATEVVVTEQMLKEVKG